MRLLRIAAIAIMLGWGTCGAVAAQDLPLIDDDGSVSGSALEPGGDLYRVVALAGTRLQAQLALSGRGAVALYGPDGAELARADGDGTATLAARIDTDAVYLLGVTRAQPGEAYTLHVSRDTSQVSFEAATPVPAAPATVAPAATAAIAPPQYDADPRVWGLYARLAGRQTTSAAGAYTPMWGWAVPGKELLEMWRTPGGTVVQVNAITLTGRPGELLMQPFRVGGKKWLGTVAADGSVVYVGEGLRKAPHRVELTPEGVYQMRRVTLRGDQVLSVEPPEERSRWNVVSEGVPAGD